MQLQFASWTTTLARTWLLLDMEATCELPVKDTSILRVVTLHVSNILKTRLLTTVFSRFSEPSKFSSFHRMKISDFLTKTLKSKLKSFKI